MLSVSARGASCLLLPRKEELVVDPRSAAVEARIRCVVGAHRTVESQRDVQFEIEAYGSDGALLSRVWRSWRQFYALLDDLDGAGFPQPLPRLPRALPTWMFDHTAPSFVAARRAGLQRVCDALCGIPCEEWVHGFLRVGVDEGEQDAYTE